jgi:transcriptional regulator with GAF, ATPase, and Fis domain
VRLLHILQSREFERVGGNKPISLDIRVIAATHRNLEEMVSKNRFREDLWFRLNVFPIIVPPLRQRIEDIPTLARHFILQKCREMGIAIPPDIAPGALDRLMHYNWPGNVREMENLVEREIILKRGGQLMFDTLYAEVVGTGRPNHESGSAELPLKLDEAMAFHISWVLKMANGKINGPGGAAELLDINANTLRGRMKKLRISYGRDKK